MKKSVLAGLVIVFGLATITTGQVFAQGEICACVNQSGAMRMATDASKCNNKEEFICWQGAPSSIDVSEYLSPDGVVKTFRVRKFGDTVSEFFSDVVWNGTEQQRTFPNGGGDIAYHIQTADGYFLYRYTTHDSNNTITSEAIMTPPVPTSLTFGNKAVGSSWGGGGMRTITAYNQDPPKVTYNAETWMWTFLGIEDVTVPAGTFENCLKLHRIKKTKAPRIIWKAKGIGTVKRVEAETDTDPGLVSELYSY